MFLPMYTDFCLIVFYACATIRRHCFQVVRRYIPKVCKCNISQSLYRILTKFAQLLQLGTKTNWLDFELKRSKFKVINLPDVFKNPLMGQFSHHRSLNDVFMWYWWFCSYRKWGQRSMSITRPNMVKKGRGIHNRFLVEFYLNSVIVWIAEIHKGWTDNIKSNNLLQWRAR